MKHKQGFFKNHRLLNFYWRIEVQQRGSLHLHGIFWLENAPTLDKNNLENLNDLINFINEYCTTDTDDLANEDLEILQRHNHSKTCKIIINEQVICRFGIPKPPMRETKILFPLSDTISEESKQVFIGFLFVNKLINYSIYSIYFRNINEIYKLSMRNYSIEI